MTVYGFVQAGGGSTRFGRDKALVQFSGQTMLERTARLLSSVCDDVFVVAPEKRYDIRDWRILPDLWPGEGPLSGILTALHRLNEVSNGVPPILALILSCDMPFLTREFLTHLRESASRSKALVVVPRSADGLEPLCSCWKPAATTVLQTAFDSGVRKVTDAMERVPMEMLDQKAWKRFDTDGRLFWNMNTPKDYEEARRILEGEGRE
jgi:molybdopterin-guanine dinucleotide biosynthesis protein A